MPKDVPPSTSPNDALLQVGGLRVYFPLRGGLAGRVRRQVKAVDGVSFEVRPAQTLALVGESGCGKTTTGRAILRLVPVTAGRVEFAGVDLLALRGPRLRRARRQIQSVFQDPRGSLNPRMTVESIVGEGLAVHGLMRGRRRRDRVAELLESVGLHADHLGRYPHEFSGGQCQRIGIARALALEPRFVVCDEPVSALDVSVQAQILTLLRRLQADLGLSYLFISHDLSVVKHFSHQVAVMYLGRIVELGTAGKLFAHPAHPYTRLLLSSVPQPDPRQDRRSPKDASSSEPPSPLDPPSGCAFHSRCRFATDKCRTVQPELGECEGLGTGHQVACHHTDRVLSVALTTD